MPTSTVIASYIFGISGLMLCLPFSIPILLYSIYLYKTNFHKPYLTLQRRPFTFPTLIYLSLILLIISPIEIFGVLGAFSISSHTLFTLHSQLLLIGMELFVCRALFNFFNLNITKESVKHGTAIYPMSNSWFLTNKDALRNIKFWIPFAVLFHIIVSIVYLGAYLGDSCVFITFRNEKKTRACAFPRGATRQKRFWTEGTIFFSKQKGRIPFF